MGGCRRILSINGCFLKDPWNGQLLDTIGHDANNQVYPIAWGVPQREDKGTWVWFMQSLVNHLEIEDGHGWTIISDQEKTNLFMYAYMHIRVRCVYHNKKLNCAP